MDRTFIERMALKTVEITENQIYTTTLLEISPPPLNKGLPARLGGFWRVNKGLPRSLRMSAREARQKKNRVLGRFTRENHTILGHFEASKTG